MFALTSTYCCINFLVGILPWTHDMSTMNLVTIVSHMAICGFTEVVPWVCTPTKPWKILVFTWKLVEHSWTLMKKRTTCLYCHWFSSIPPELPGCVVPSLEKSGYTSTTHTNREPQAASHAWWMVHTTGHHLDIETKMLRNRAEQVRPCSPAARWQWWNGPHLAMFGPLRTGCVFFFIFPLVSQRLSLLGYEWNIYGISMGYKSIYIIYIYITMCVLFFQQRLF